MATRLDNLRNRGVAVRAAVLGAAVSVALALAIPVAAYLHGGAAILAATIAACLCLAGAASALIVTGLLRGPQRALAALLMGMAMRMGIPLILGLALQVRGGLLAQAGVLYYILIFYAVTLAVETALSLPPSRRPADPAQRSSNGVP
jgi:hypothetical protein